MRRACGVATPVESPFARYTPDVIASELQDIVDHLATELASAVVLEDAEQRVIVYSSQHGTTDEVRRDSILHRSTAAAVVEWFQQFGISQATDVLWIPAHQQLGILGRVCCPVRYRGQLLGFLWLIDDDGVLYETRREAILGYHSQLALLLYEHQLTQRLRLEVVSHLLSSIPELQAAAAAAIADRGLWQRGAQVCAVVATVADADATVDLTVPTEALAVLSHRALVESLEDVARDALGSDALRATFADHVAVLVPCWSAEDARPDKVGAALIEAVQSRLDGTGGALRVVAGVGDLQPSLGRAQSSYRQARLAAKVAGVISTGGACSRWRDLGVFRTLAQLPSWGASDLELDPRVTVLLREVEPDILRSVETYLDLGCDVRKTSAALHLHRGTLYYRIEKVERLTGLDLRDGNDRLCVHLGFKIARLAGSYPR